MFGIFQMTKQYWHWRHAWYCTIIFGWKQFS